ncbi:uncharacterized protein LOC114364540 [Ostrinia furnacalis]|uniref:uncharacterized protein LOC114364540 n=1 Tax=Ostrinia furnacalis TaxID=93504 RepID=UPI00103B2E88|nr:uncharacterized protein LOC114364540 [Ostrinia furnacalis]
MAYNIVLLLFAILNSAVGVRINFTSCQSPEWSCNNNLPNEIVYTCANVLSNDFIIHLKDYYTDHITSVTVQNCRDVRVVLDCPLLQRPSQLQRFKIKDCDRVEFVSLSSTSLLQTPPEVTIENAREVVSLPRKIFKSPVTNTELKCIGAHSMRKIRIVNSKINTINTRAIYNVTGIKSIEFENVTITNVENQAIEAIMGNDNTLFSMVNCKIENLNFKGIVVRTKTAVIDNNVFDDLIANVVNITSDVLQMTKNTIKDIYSNALLLRSVNTDITNNNINLLKINSLIGVKCLRKRISNKYFIFSKNKIRTVEPYSLAFDYASCKSAGTTVSVNHNKIDCKCRNISYLTSSPTNVELNNMFLDVVNNNTCISAPCSLPVEVVKLLLESDMCQLNLDPQVMCLLYSDRHNNNNDMTTDEDVTEPAPTFYLIRQANSPNGDASAAMTAIDKDYLLKGSNLNMTNRTAIKVVFDSSRDFVETLRSTGTHKRPVEEPKTPQTVEYVSRCVGNQCRNNVVYDRQKALDFYKYVYAQLRPPRQMDKKKIT